MVLQSCRLYTAGVLLSCLSHTVHTQTCAWTNDTAPQTSSIQSKSVAKNACNSASSASSLQASTTTWHEQQTAPCTKHNHQAGVATVNSSNATVWPKPQEEVLSALVRMGDPQQLLTFFCGGRLRAMTGLPVFLNTGAAARSRARATRSSCSASAAAAFRARANCRRSLSLHFSPSATCQCRWRVQQLQGLFSLSHSQKSLY